MNKTPMLAYQTRVRGSIGHLAALDAYAALYGKAERSLFAAIQSNRITDNELKSTFMRRFGLVGRQYNSVRAGLDGKVTSITERRPELIAESQQRIKRAEKVFARLTARGASASALHQKKRRLATLRARLASLKADHQKKNRPSMLRLAQTFSQPVRFSGQWLCVEGRLASRLAIIAIQSILRPW